MQTNDHMCHIKERRHSQVAGTFQVVGALVPLLGLWIPQELEKARINVRLNLLYGRPLIALYQMNP